MHFPAKQTVALALALLSTRTVASSVKAEEGFPHKRDDANIEVARIHARIHAREFAPVLYGPLAVRTEGAKRVDAMLHEDHDEILDDISPVLEENSEDFVRGYIQKGDEKKGDEKKGDEKKSGH
jgi:ubiquitin-like protein Pup